VRRLIPLVTCLVLAACEQSRNRSVEPSGAATTVKTEALKAGAAALQGQAPLRGMDVYIVGFHPMKDNPQSQMEAHHFCKQVNEDFAQCALFDGNTENANLNGLEFIISEKLFNNLPAEEKQYWHPHNYEILSGQLQAPGLPKAAEKEFMRQKMNSYGKTWHVWSTHSGAKLPMGPAMLAWSFNADGEARAELIQKRDQAMGLDTLATRKDREDLKNLARPQQGTTALKFR
jgi:hypothetical protein